MRARGDTRKAAESLGIDVGRYARQLRQTVYPNLKRAIAKRKSFDSMAWSLQANTRGSSPRTNSIKCNNCLKLRRKNLAGVTSVSKTLCYSGSLLLGIIRCGYCGGACTSSFVNKKRKDGTTQRYYYYKCTTKSRRDANSCQSADLRASLIDGAFVDYFRELANQPKVIKAVVTAAGEAAREGVSGLEAERT